MGVTKVFIKKHLMGAKPPTVQVVTLAACWQHLCPTATLFLAACLAPCSAEGGDRWGQGAPDGPISASACQLAQSMCFTAPVLDQILGPPWRSTWGPPTEHTTVLARSPPRNVTPPLPGPYPHPLEDSKGRRVLSISVFFCMECFSDKTFVTPQCDFLMPLQASERFSL